MYAIGFSAFYHDSAVALSKDSSVLFAAQEERFTRVKGDSTFPTNSFIEALKYLVKDYKKSDQDPSSNIIDVSILYYENFYIKALRSFFLILKEPSLIGLVRFVNMLLTKNPFRIRNIVKKTIKAFEKSSRSTNITFCVSYKASSHHLSHALSAHGVSGFDCSIGLVIDGVGEIDTISLWYFKGSKYKRLREHAKFPNSLGLFYALITSHLGFKVNSGEYKVMGLAPYGKQSKTHVLRKILNFSSKFPFYRLDQNFLSFTSLSIASSRLENIVGFKKRKEESKLTEAHLDTAASLQLITEESLENILAYLSDKYPGVPLTYSGGVALNCKANRLISKYFRNYFIQPAANDAGGSIGASLLPNYTYDVGLPISSVENNIQYHADDFNPFLGIDIFNSEVKDLLDDKCCTYHYMDDSELALKAASLIFQENYVVAVCRNRMEFGPRALGNRSIICDPRIKTNQSRINRIVKKREDFRPFAPCILEEYVSEYYDGYCDKYMLTTATAKDSISNYSDAKSDRHELISSNHITSKISSVVHVDLSARVQIVTEESSPFLHRVLTNFYALSQIPVLVNTSFNQRGEPIVCTAIDAFECFFSVDLDALILGNYLIYKSENSHISISDRRFQMD